MGLRRIALVAGCVLCVGLAGACSDNGDGPDAGFDGLIPLPDGYGPLWPCTEPGKVCNAHDTCAINPICGPDLLCRPSALQNCDDGLTCTKDTCKGTGLCENTPLDGWCALMVPQAATKDGGVGTSVMKCLRKGDKKPGDPCVMCDPTQDKKRWTGATGGKCDDGTACTKDDYCQSGVCKGTYYGSQCADQYSCTDDVCDGLGGCKGNPLKSGWCLIANTCYKDGTKDPSGACKKCNATLAPNAWTTITSSCQIGGKCYDKGEKHLTCSECVPTTSSTSWTVVGSYCLIDDVCKNPGDKDPTQCSSCVPGTNPYKWTPLTGLCSIAGQCYSSGATHPQGCASCVPGTSQDKWTVTGSYCLIDGVCKNPGDKDPIQCASCVTTDKYKWTPLAGMCSIDGKCYSSGATHTQGCASCVPGTSPTAWTPSSNKCVIDQVCYDATTAHSSGCGVCTPSASQTSWTISGSSCIIGNKCYSSGTTEVGGCGTCDPTKSKSAWTKASGCLVTHAWSKGFGGTSSDYGYDIAVDVNGNIYVVGTFYGTIDLGGGTLTSTGSNDIFVASFSPSGAHRWSKAFGSTSYDYGYGIALDSSANVYITGYFSSSINFGGSALTSVGGYDMFLASFTSGGTHRWSKGFGSTGTDYGYGVATDPSDNVYLTGAFYNSINFGGSALTSVGYYDTFLASFTSGGAHRWSKGFGSTDYDYGYAVATDANSNVYITGYFYYSISFGGSTLTSAGSYDAFLASFTSSGTHRWSKSFGSTSGDYGYDVATDPSGNVFLTGSFYSTIDLGGGTITSVGSTDLYVASFTAAGTHRWSKGFGSTSSDYGYGVAADPSGNVYLTGYYYYSIDFGGGTLTSAGSYDGFVASLSPTGSHRWSRSFGSTSSDYGRAVAADGAGRTYVTGYYYYNPDLGGGALPNAGSQDAFVLKLAP